MDKFEAPVPVFKADGETVSNGKTVLVVDDDPVFRKATGIKLHFSGFEVRTAKENSEAIAALGQELIDAVIMDIQFPADVFNGGMGSWDGFQIMQWMQGLPGGHGVRFIIVSSSDLAAYRQRAQQLGAVAFLPKPVDYEQLIEALNEAAEVPGRYASPTTRNVGTVPGAQQSARAANAMLGCYKMIKVGCFPFPIFIIQQT